MKNLWKKSEMSVTGTHTDRYEVTGRTACFQGRNLQLIEFVIMNVQYHNNFTCWLMVPSSSTPELT